MIDADSPAGVPSASHEWNAGAYHELSDPQFIWGLRVLERLPLRGSERVLDAGCGSGRLTRELATRVPHGFVVGCDLSENMVRAAADTLRGATDERIDPSHVAVTRADLLALPWRGVFDAAFSTATLHWVHDHDRAFAELRRALTTKAQLEAQCGGGPNLARIHARAKRLSRTEPFHPFFASWRDPWLFASPEETEARLRQAGFVRVRCWLEEAPTPLTDELRYRSFLEAVVMRPFLAALTAPELRVRFLDAMVAEARGDDPPFTLDYWRLNISASTF